MRYTGRLFYPAGARLELDLRNLSPIQGHTAYELYGQFKREMNSDATAASSESTAAIIQSLTSRFCVRVGAPCEKLFARCVFGCLQNSW